MDRQTEAVSAHLRKFEEEIKCKMDGMKKQKLNKEELEKYYK